MRFAGLTQGMVLWEALVVMAIVGVLAAVAVPGFTQARRSAVLTAAANQMLGGLHFARSTSILRGIPAVLCLSADGARCVNSPADHALGWLIFLDYQRSSPPQRDAADELIREVDLPPDVAVQATRQALTYWPITRSGTTGTFTFCNASASGAGSALPGALAVVVSQTGRPRVTDRVSGGCAQ